MKNSIFGGFTIALSFTMVVEWMQTLLLIIGIISALIPLIKTAIDTFKGSATVKELQEKLNQAEEEIKYLNDLYDPSRGTKPYYVAGRTHGKKD